MSTAKLISRYIESPASLPRGCLLAQYTGMDPGEAAAKFEAKYGWAPLVVYCYTNSTGTLLSIEVENEQIGRDVAVPDASGGAA